ncbi:hypothetical protein ANN_09996 [Periplaneta americana]|uniref:Per a allergen n=1 Tax=Periplaneta americana TaxID=6978 RepID=A0ABQ8TMV1_PERAM|nr:hypothetical protein ANN_09996 [Periplaneta americana]
MDLREVGYDDRDWINLAQDGDQWRAYVRAEMNLRVPEKPFVKECDAVLTAEPFAAAVAGRRRVVVLLPKDQEPDERLAEGEVLLHLGVLRQGATDSVGEYGDD